MDRASFKVAPDMEARFKRFLKENQQHLRAVGRMMLSRYRRCAPALPGFCSITFHHILQSSAARRAIWAVEAAVFGSVFFKVPQWFLDKITVLLLIVLSFLCLCVFDLYVCVLVACVPAVFVLAGLWECDPFPFVWSVS